MLRKLLLWMRHPSVFILTLSNHGLLMWLNDKTALKMIYRFQTGKRLNLDSPQTFNEKLQWLKLYDRKTAYSIYVDKIESKNFVKQIIGEEYIIPTLKIWSSPSEIQIDELPQQFVLKCNHDSGGIVLCKDKNHFDIDVAKQKLKKHFKRSGYWVGREWPYKNVKKHVFAEEYLSNPSFDVLVVYKVFCFNGKPEMIQVIQNDKSANESIDYFDCNWNLLKLKQNHPNSSVHLPKPEKLEEMLSLTKQIMIDAPFVRIDWYISNNRLYFSEYTLYSDNGFALFEPEEWDQVLGEKIVLKKD